MNEFFSLTPDRVLDAVESFGFKCTGRCLALNSLENRVYEVEVENSKSDSGSEMLVAKFYRPNRWTKDQIQEEHDFVWELAAQELPVVAPIRNSYGKTIYTVPELQCYTALFPKRSGRMEPESSKEELVRLGRLVARMHQVGSRSSFKHRMSVNPKWYLWHNFEDVQRFIAPEYKKNYKDILSTLDAKWSDILDFKFIRLHGDLHRGNILWRYEEEQSTPLLVDFDDSIFGPVVQDFWLLFGGRIKQENDNFMSFLEGYEMFLEFDDRQLSIVELLRAFRMVQYTGWICKRWEDPSFRKVFPDINSNNYWSNHILDLQEQLNWI